MIYACRMIAGGRAATAVPSKRGRKTVLTPDRRQRVIRLMSEGTSRNRTARIIGCAPSTITYGALRDRAFGRAVAHARATHLRRLSDTLLAALHPRPAREPEPPKPPAPRATATSPRRINALDEFLGALARERSFSPQSKIENPKSEIVSAIAENFQRVTGRPLDVDRLLAAAEAVRGSPKKRGP